MIRYTPLWETLKRKKLSTYTLIKDHGFSKGTLDALKHDRNITMATLNDICNLLDCTPDDVIAYTPDQ
ncbi:MAG: helix-turn-helix transcriptional regulator [Oscillospiraceae bacterium]|nr:helix-turn-helix transcriptional regulator [Oscillospiraceae bacterium]MBR4657534.1 helix-turn-helix transcriptional regulator [Oscillospiraceae bacterium]